MVEEVHDCAAWREKFRHYRLRGEVDESTGLTPFHMACATSACESCIQHVVSCTADSSSATSWLEQPCNTGQTPIHWAIAKENVRLLDYFLEFGQGRGIHKKDLRYAMTPLHFACGLCNKDVVRRLLLLGASPDEQDRDGATPLHLAVKRGSIACVQLLIESGGNVNIVDCKGQTALHAAFLQDEGIDVVESICSLLIQSKVDISIRDHHGQTAFDLLSVLAVDEARASELSNLMNLLKAPETLQPPVTAEAPTSPLLSPVNSAVPTSPSTPALSSGIIAPHPTPVVGGASRSVVNTVGDVPALNLNELLGSAIGVAGDTNSSEMDDAEADSDGMEFEKNESRQHSLFSGNVLVHIDFKGAPPKMQWMISVLPIIRQFGGTGLLVEWEDMLPFTGELEVVRSPNAYSEGDIFSFLQEAETLGLDVVPLVQTFGHLEYVLKHEAFAHLREQPDNFMDLCPSATGAIDLARTLVDQVVRLHPSAEYIHLGADEIFALGSCDVCSLRAREEDSKTSLYTDHMGPIISHARHHGLTPMIWDDIFRDWDVEKMQSLSNAIPVAWAYGREVSDEIADETFRRYTAVFDQIWAASAFKGAMKPDTDCPSIAHYSQNHVSWCAKARKVEFGGIVLTGWSRFTHTTVLCETLVAAIPSLCVCLAVVWERHYSDAIKQRVMERLDASTQSPENKNPSMAFDLAAYKLFSQFEDIKVAQEATRQLSKLYLPSKRRNPSQWSQIEDRARHVSELTATLATQLRSILEPILYQNDVDEIIDKFNVVIQEAEAINALVAQTKRDIGL